MAVALTETGLTPAHHIQLSGVLSAISFMPLPVWPPATCSIILPIGGTPCRYAVFSHPGA